MMIIVHVFVLRKLLLVFRADKEGEDNFNERQPKLGRTVSDMSASSDSSMHHKRRSRR